MQQFKQYYSTFLCKTLHALNKWYKIVHNSTTLQNYTFFGKKTLQYLNKLYTTLHNNTKHEQNCNKTLTKLFWNKTLHNFTKLYRTLQVFANLYKKRNPKQLKNHAKLDNNKHTQYFTTLYNTLHNYTQLYTTLQQKQNMYITSYKTIQN